MLHRFFESSTKRTAELQKFQKKYNGTTSKIIENAVTRWLSHDRVSRCVRECFIPLIKALETMDDPKGIAKGVHNFFCTDQFVYTLCTCGTFCLCSLI